MFHVSHILERENYLYSSGKNMSKVWSIMFLLLCMLIYWEIAVIEIYRTEKKFQEEILLKFPQNDANHINIPNNLVNPFIHPSHNNSTTASIIFIAQQSIETLRGTHGRFDVDRAHVLPVLFQQRHQKVDGQRNVGNQFLRRHINVANGDGQAQNLKQY